MSNKIERRDFIKKSALFGAVAFAGASSLPKMVTSGISSEKINIAVVEGADYFNNTIKAVEMLGGMKKFVSKGQKVGLLINHQKANANPGSFTNPEIVLAAIKMCIDAGAGEITFIKVPSPEYWNRTPKSAEFQKEIEFVKKNPGIWESVEIAKGIALKKAEMTKAYLECDVIINLPVGKQHSATSFTGNLKNMMGACNRPTNQFFHNGSGQSNDVNHISQCIADVNLMKRPTFSICDSTEFLLTNGPSGPGELKKAQKIVAGADCVAVDAYCSTLIGVTPEQILTTKKAYEHGLGEMDLKKLLIKEVKV